MLLRPARPDDSAAVARVHVRSWQIGYRGLLPDAYLDGLRPEDREKRYTFGASDPQLPATMVAVEDGEICGFVTTAPFAGAQDVGEVCALYVDPDFWARGFGAGLISAARAHLVGSGFKTAALWLLRGNSRGDRFYRKDGWLPDGTQRKSEVWGTPVDELLYRRALP